jgi:outer membrane receptor protein involved in Fe transport
MSRFPAKRDRAGSLGQKVLLAAFATFLIAFFLHSSQSQTLSGIVSDEQNHPIENAEVTVNEGTKTIARSRTDQRGAFSISPAAGNTLLLLVNAKGFASYSSVINSGQAKPLVIVLTPAIVRDEVTVSVMRTTSRLSETPASVVVLTHDVLESTAAQSVDDALRQIAGFTLFRRSSSKTTNPTAQGANLRGVSGSGASRAEVLLDGLSLNDAFGGWTFWSRVPLIAVDQIEVLRGGASSFYGSSGLSGAVNLVTSQAENNRPILRFETSAGSQGTYDGSIFAAAGRRGWNVSLAADTFQTAGYIPVTESQGGLADARANSRHESGLITVEKRFGDNSLQPAGRIFVRGNIFGERRDNGTGLTYNKTYFRQAAIGGDHSGGRLGTIQFRSFVESQVYDQTFSAVSADRNAETLSRLQRVPSQAAGGNVFWSRPFGGHSVSALFEAREVRGFSNETGYFGGRPASLSGSGGRERTWSAFGQDMWAVTPKLTLSLGGRIDRWSNFGAHAQTLTIATGAVADARFPDRTETAFSPRFATLFRVNGSLSLYGSYSRSFRAPTLNELYRGFRVGNVVTLANENLKAEHANTFEGGAGLKGFGGAFEIRGNIYFIEVSDPVVSVTLFSTPSLITRQRQNVGRTRTLGIEADADIVPRKDLRLSISYLLADPRVTNFPGNHALIGKLLPQVARQQLNFQLYYHPGSRFSAGVQTRFSSGQFEDDLNTLRLRPYFTADAKAAFRIRKTLEVFVASENLFNSRYDIGLTPNRTTAAPAFVRAGLRLDLGKR